MTSPRGLLLVCLVLVLGAAMASGCSSVSDRVPRRVHAGVAAFAQPSLGCPVEAIPVRHPKSESMNASTSLRGAVMPITSSKRAGKVSALCVRPTKPCVSWRWNQGAPTRVSRARTRRVLTLSRWEPVTNSGSWLPAQKAGVSRTEGRMPMASSRIVEWAVPRGPRDCDYHRSEKI